MRQRMRKTRALLLGIVAGCRLPPDPPPNLPKEAFGGTGDLMARCMAYASQSYCQDEIWGDNTR